MISRPAIAAQRLGPSSRYELKYFASPATVEQLRLAITGRARPDHYASGRPGNRYSVNSLYFDSPDLTLYRATVGGHKARFKLRLRRYDESNTDSVYAEIKRRISDVIVKTRVPVAKAVADAVEQWTLGGRQPAVGELPDLAPFVQALSLLEARPALRVRYMREAYETTAWPAVRITFDFDIAYSIAQGWGHTAIWPRWYRLPVDGAVVEIKFTDVFPAWLTELVHALELRRQPIPKYALAVSDAGSLHAQRPGSGSVGLPFLSAMLPRIF